MHILSTHEADQLLLVRGLRIGGWNEISSIVSGDITKTTCLAPREALPLYVFAEAVLNWMAPSGWVILQFDNSTAPTDDEIGVFERLMLFEDRQWNIAEQRTFLFDEPANVLPDKTRTVLVLLVFFSLLFEWHVHLVSERTVNEARLALQDGIVYFFGNAMAIESANALVKQLVERPLVRPEY